MQLHFDIITKLFFSWPNSQSLLEATTNLHRDSDFRCKKIMKHIDFFLTINIYASNLFAHFRHAQKEHSENSNLEIELEL